VKMLAKTKESSPFSGCKVSLGLYSQRENGLASSFAAFCCTYYRTASAGSATLVSSLTHTAAKLVTIRALLNIATPDSAPEPQDYRERYATLTGRSLDTCPCCGGHMVEIAVLTRAALPPRPFCCDSS
jgi:hypothetical protein